MRGLCFNASVPPKCKSTCHLLLLDFATCCRHQVAMRVSQSRALTFVEVECFVACASGRQVSPVRGRGASRDGVIDRHLRHGEELQRFDQLLGDFFCSHRLLLEDSFVSFVGSLRCRYLQIKLDHKHVQHVP